jgi:predicted nucleic acid-binding protein
MIVVYLETSSLLRVLFRQAAYEPIAALLENDGSLVVTSTLTLLESRRVVVRACVGRLIKEGEASKMLGLLAEQEGIWQILDITALVLARAGQTFPLEPVRTLDALHLASALELKKIYPELLVCTHDDRIAANLEPLGIGRCRF